MQPTETHLNNDWWDDLPESHKQRVEKGIDDLENGRVLTSTEFWEVLLND